MCEIELYNDDCREVLKQIVFKKHPVIITDPPFNVGYHYGTYKDNMADEDYYSMLKEIFADKPFVIIHYPESIYKVAQTLNRVPSKVVSWVYNSNTAKQHRDIAFFDIQPDFDLVVQPYKNPDDKRVKAMIAKGSRGGRLYDWWNVNQVKNVSKVKTQHPCQMPQEILDNIVGILPDKENIVVIDTFMGSGTTGIACKKHNVDFIGIELDKEYFKIAKDRIYGEYEQKSVTKQSNIFDYLS